MAMESFAKGKKSAASRYLRTHLGLHLSKGRIAFGHHPTAQITWDSLCHTIATVWQIASLIDRPLDPNRLCGLCAQ